MGYITHHARRLVVTANRVLACAQGVNDIVENALWHSLPMVIVGTSGTVPTLAEQSALWDPCRGACPNGVGRLCLGGDDHAAYLVRSVTSRTVDLTCRAEAVGTRV